MKLDTWINSRPDDQHHSESSVNILFLKQQTASAITLYICTYIMHNLHNRNCRKLGFYAPHETTRYESSVNTSTQQTALDNTSRAQ